MSSVENIFPSFKRLLVKTISYNPDTGVKEGIVIKAGEGVINAYDPCFEEIRIIYSEKSGYEVGVEDGIQFVIIKENEIIAAR